MKLRWKILLLLGIVITILNLVLWKTSERVLQEALNPEQARHALAYFMAWAVPASLAAGLAIYLILDRLLILRRREHDSERLFQRLALQAADAFFLFEPGGRFVELNRKACDLLGYTRREMLGLSWEGIEADGILPEGVFPGGAVTAEMGLRRKDGAVLPVEASLSHFQSGGRSFCFAVVRDIAERKRAEENLRESRESYKRLTQEFQVLLDGIPDSLTLLGADGKVIWANAGTARLLGIPPEKLPGSSCIELWHGGEDLCPECPALRSFRTGRTEEMVDRTPDGRIWGVKAFPLADPSGRITGVIRLASDITEKFRLREEAERAGRLASLGELAAGVAHEINNPNALILLNAPILRDAWQAAGDLLEEHFQKHGDFPLGRLPWSRMRDVLPSLNEEILDSSRRIRRIVEDLKEFVRHDSAAQAEEVDLNAVVAAACRLTANTVKKSTHYFSVSCAEDVPRVHGIFQRIEQVAVNLIMNACQALTDSSRTVSVTTRYDHASGRVLLTVSDEGSGIDPQDLPRITEPFFTTKRESGGTGLGLSVSARIVREHNGTLEFSSVLGRGTTATLALPALREIAHGKKTRSALPESAPAAG